MQLISHGDFYMGIDQEEYCQFDIHLGRLRIEYSCPRFKNDGTKSSEETNGRQD
jgi:hypothetical protein